MGKCLTNPCDFRKNFRTTKTGQHWKGWLELLPMVWWHSSHPCTLGASRIRRSPGSVESFPCWSQEMKSWRTKASSFKTSLLMFELSLSFHLSSVQLNSARRKRDKPKPLPASESLWREWLVGWSPSTSGTLPCRSHWLAVWIGCGLTAVF